jgi:N-acetylglucosaminyl-diphospho-decaprenol L-rhamnosyltransferase
VIIPSWNSAAVLDPCLESLKSQEIPGGFEVIVVDNGSTDDTDAVLARHAGHVRAIRNKHNAGYAGANNQAAAEARGEVLYFVNSDTEMLERDVLALLADALDDPRVGLVGPKLLNPDGTLQPSCAGHPTILRALLTSAGVHRVLPDSALRRVAPDFWSHDASVDTGWLLGAVLAIRTDLFHEMGGLWSTEYAEDQDLAYRVQQRGLAVRFVEPARVMHVGNFTLGQVRTDAQRAARVAEAELAFLRAYYSRPRAAAIRALVWCGYAGRAVVHRLVGRAPRAAVFRAMAQVYSQRAS